MGRVEKLSAQKPRCVAIVIGEAAEYRERRGHKLLCGRISKYGIDGEAFCSLHAGMRALSILMKESK